MNVNHGKRIARKVPVEGLTARELIEDYGMRKSSAYDAVKRGYYIEWVEPEYSSGFTKEHVKRFEYAATKAYEILQKKRDDVFLADKDDLIQTALLRIIEVNKKIDNVSFLIGVARNAMRNYLHNRHDITYHELNILDDFEV